MLLCFYWFLKHAQYKHRNQPEVQHMEVLRAAVQPCQPAAGMEWDTGDHPLPVVWSQCHKELAVAQDGLIWGRTTALFCTFMVLHRGIKLMFPLSSQVSAQIPTSAQK